MVSPVKSAEYPVSIGRLDSESLKAFRDTYVNLLGQEESIDVKFAEISQILTQAFRNYQTQGSGVTPLGFRSYLENQQEQATESQALNYLNGHRDLFRNIEALGLTPLEVKVSKRIILSQINLSNLNLEGLIEAIEGLGLAEIADL